MGEKASKTGRQAKKKAEVDKAEKKKLRQQKQAVVSRTISGKSTKRTLNGPKKKRPGQHRKNKRKGD